jgi:FKBP-type peptidyl-prolyl cis-trans isomerase FklB
MATLGCGQATAAAGGADLASEEAQQGYSLGYAIGHQISQTIDDVDLAALAKGFGDAAQQREAALGTDVMQLAIAGYEASRAEAARADLAALAAANSAAGDAFRAEFARKPGVTTLDNGLSYRVIEPGAGDPPEAGSEVTLHYRGSLVDGTALDESYSRGEPITIPLDQALPGWTAALERMPQGAKWEVVIPPSLAYGEAGASGFVEPNTTLVFEFERVAS